ncbi:MAG: DMT family transporter [Actinomycetota bacterium]
MAVLWGSLTSLAIGFGDLCYARVSNRMALVTLMVLSSVGGVAMGLVALPLIDGAISWNATLVGLGSGSVMGVALILYLQAMKITTISVTSPITAVLAALLPVVWEVVVDEELPSGWVATGAAVALGSLTLTTWSPESKGRVWAGARWAIGSGALYGVGNIVLGQADDGTGAWPAVFHRGAGVIIFGLGVLVVGLPKLPPLGTRRLVFLGGMLGNVAVVCFLFGVETGDLGVLSVAASLFPVVSVTLLFLFAAHPARWWQGVGVLGAVAGVALIAAG